MSDLLNEKVLLEAKRNCTLQFQDGSKQQIEIDEDLERTIQNPYDFDISKLYRNTEKFNLNVFYSLLRDIILDACKRKGLSDITVTHDYPPTDFSLEKQTVITFKLVRRWPGGNGQDGEAYRVKKPKYAYQYLKEDIIQVNEAPKNHLIEISVWSLKNKEADEIVLWLENLLIHYSWAFELKGAERFYFEERLMDMYEIHEGQKIHSRSLRFFMRYSELTFLSFPALKQMNIKFKLKQ